MKVAARRRLAPVAGLLSLLLAGTAAPPNRPPATPLNPAAAVADVVGHPSQHHVRAETVSVRDGERERSTLDVDAKIRLEEDCEADLCHGAWFDSVGRFTYGINGTPFRDRERDDRVQRTFAAIASTAFAEPAFVAGGGHVRKDDGGTPDNVRYRVAAWGGTDLIAVADARTQRLKAVERTDGSLYAQLFGSGTAAAFVYATRRYQRVAIVSEPLSVPAGPRVQSREDRDIALLPGPLPIVACQVAGRNATCLIDTGTTPSAMTLNFAEQIGREPHGAIEIAGLGSYLTGVVDIGPVDVGSASISSLRFAVVPRIRNGSFDVILGSDALALVRLELDPDRHRARITADGSASRADVARGESNINFEAGLPFTDVRVGSRPSETMLVDTGDTGTVSIGYDEYRADPELFTPLEHSVASGLGATGMDALDGRIASIDVGPTHIDDVAISAVRGQHQPHLGYGFAAHCGRFVLELAEGRLECQGNLKSPKLYPAGL